MKKGAIAAFIVFLMLGSLLSGCERSSEKEKTGNKQTENKPVESISVEESKSSSIEKPEQSDVKESRVEEKNDDEESLAQRMTGKYSYHYPGDNGEEEFLIMDVVNFGNNLYAFCGQAMSDDYESFEAYTFWACEFIPYDEKEMASIDGDKVKVNVLTFSIMSNAGKYWDSGHTGTITHTDDGLIFEGFDHDGFLVPAQDDSRLFLKDERVEDAFSYLKPDYAVGDESLRGYWVSEDKGVDTYIRFSGSNLYMYKKSPDEEVFFAAGGCSFHNGSFDCTGNCIQNGGMPFEFTADYKMEGDNLSIVIQGSDAPYQMPGEALFERISERDIHVTTMDEVVFNEDSFGPAGYKDKEPFYGLWVDAFKEESDAKALVAKLEDKGLPASYVYSCDWENLNKEPYYCVTVGRSVLEFEARAYMDDVKAAGYASAYIKYSGDHIDR